jgi:hypothetical protein
MTTPRGSLDVSVVDRHDCSRSMPLEPRTTQRAAESSVPAIHVQGVAASTRFAVRSTGLARCRAGSRSGLTSDLSTATWPNFAGLDHSSSCIRPLSRAPALQYVHSSSPVPACQYPLRVSFEAISRARLTCPPAPRTARRRHSRRSPSHTRPSPSRSLPANSHCRHTRRR